MSAAEEIAKIFREIIAFKDGMIKRQNRRIVSLEREVQEKDERIVSLLYYWRLYITGEQPQPIGEAQPAEAQPVEAQPVEAEATVGQKRKRQRPESDTVPTSCKNLRKATKMNTKKVKLFRLMGLKDCKVRDFHEMAESIFEGHRSLLEWTRSHPRYQQTCAREPPYFVLQGEWLKWHPVWTAHFQACTSCSQIFQ